MDEEKKPVSVCFHYVKSNYFRVIHADGMYGGLTPCGGIFFALYSDRQPLPSLRFSQSSKRVSVTSRLSASAFLLNDFKPWRTTAMLGIPPAGHFNVKPKITSVLVCKAQCSCSPEWSSLSCRYFLRY